MSFKNVQKSLGGRGFRTLIMVPRESLVSQLSFGTLQVPRTLLTPFEKLKRKKSYPNQKEAFLAAISHKIQ